MRRGLALLALFGVLLSACYTIPSDPYALHTVHQSTLSRVFDRASIVAVVFAAGRHALVADQHGAENRRLYLVDLEEAREQVLDLPAGRALLLYELVNAGDVALAIFWDSGTMADKVGYRVATDGSLHPLQYVGAAASFGAGATAGQLPALLAAGRLDNLTRVEREVCKFSPTSGSYQAAGESPERYYFNGEYLVFTNLPTMTQALDLRSTLRTGDRCAEHEDPQADVYKVVLQRIPTPEASQSDLDARVLRADVYRGGKFLWRYEFDLATEYYYWAGIVGQRLYFVGNFVRYLDLAPLRTPAPGP